MSDALSARFVSAEELHVTFDETRIPANIWLDDILWRKFLQQFLGVNALRIEGGYNCCIAPVLLQDHKESDDVLARFGRNSASHGPCT